MDPKVNVDHLEKRIVSQILKQKREWIKSAVKLPDDGQRVVIRMVHEETKTGHRVVECNITGKQILEIYPLEDLAIARYESNGCVWYISPPHPRYDYSPLSNKDRLKEGTAVSHWAVPETDPTDELMGWDTRFDRIREYKKLILQVDPENEEDVYRALLWAGSALSAAAGADIYQKGTDFRKAYEIICDLQNCLDVRE